MDQNLELPWRGSESDRPDLPIPPDRMPMRADGQTRKRWRYIGVFGEELMLCAARVQVGPFGQCFWAAWDRDSRRQLGHTSFRPGSREVRMDGPRVGIESRGLRAELRLGASSPIEVICPSGSSWAWTRKRAGVPVSGSVEAGGRRWDLNALGVDDESAGYHQRHTSWCWSAGIGRAEDGRPLAWNLVEGINDPAANSERTVWIDGEPLEPAAVSFHADAVEFPDGGTLDFSGECERSRSDNLLLFRSSYRHRFGTFSGSLGTLRLAEGFGVMEEHEALW